ncbi:MULTISPECIES: hypothetical protein [Streptomyces]|uniref:hypothetical protein n=1 Tax=Streptomyces TaxID=1883 RepID=UPI000B4FDFB3|nr:MULTISPECIES: hypothetical protein [unclassified Streptomyces]MYW99894.1 hypothetical protein [Streptomyces sp. SID8378]SNB89860.1 hypothetical protein SAMN02745831_06154 [Streptomyces sp. PgraA7]
MELEAGIALGAAVVSGVAAGVAVWQGRAASRSAKSADRQAKAAEEQVQLMRRQLEREDDDRHIALQPDLQVSGHLDREGRYVNEPRGLLTVSQKGGAALESVTVRASGAEVRGVYLKTRSEEFTSTPEVELGAMTDGTEQSFGVAFDYNVMTPVRTELLFTCQERNGSGRWDVHRVVSLSELPPPAPRRLGGTRGVR